MVRGRPIRDAGDLPLDRTWHQLPQQVSLGRSRCPRVVDAQSPRRGSAQWQCHALPQHQPPPQTTLVVGLPRALLFFDDKNLLAATSTKTASAASLGPASQLVRHNECGGGKPRRIRCCDRREARHPLHDPQPDACAAAPEGRLVRDQPEEPIRQRLQTRSALLARSARLTSATRRHRASYWKAKMRFQSFLMLMMVQPSFFASS
jgi:hypothetical protein